MASENRTNHLGTYDQRNAMIADYVDSEDRYDELARHMDSSTGKKRSASVSTTS